MYQNRSCNLHALLCGIFVRSQLRLHGIPNECICHGTEQNDHSKNVGHKRYWIMQNEKDFFLLKKILRLLPLPLNFANTDDWKS